ncbi:unnamed protein product [Moneuplotes crassus]|uniref:Uncharacterized protein n=1 Tax=Euplotes crassus TaxID=5936 RepID=A0AAD1XCF8_EUPCR|nr:unnamed protein product [Moneuplotes crassus]
MDCSMFSPLFFFLFEMHICEDYSPLASGIYYSYFLLFHLSSGLQFFSYEKNCVHDFLASNWMIFDFSSPSFEKALVIYHSFKISFFPFYY